MRIVLKPAGIICVLTLIGGLSLYVLDRALPRGANNKDTPYTTTNLPTPPGKIDLPSVNLTTEGKLDWCVWGSYQSGNSEGSLHPLHKAKPKVVIGDLALVGPSQPWSAGTFRGMFWNDGAKITKVIRVATGLYTAGAGNGFTFSVPVGPENRTLRVYVQGKNAEPAFSATLSRSKKAPAVDMKEDVATDGTYCRIYTVHFRSSEPGDTMKVSWVVTKPLADNDSNIALQAVSLQ